MQVFNSSDRYGLVSVILHWLVALAVFGLVALGTWMVDLSYYDPWYRKGPDLHRSVGVLLFAVMLFRLLWRGVNTEPAALPGHRRWERTMARTVHRCLYVLVFLVMISGYLISTADDSSVVVFGLFSVPSVTGTVKGMEDVAGEVHFWAAWTLVTLVALHALGALKHHLMDRDRTLLRMLGR
ncbi:cytochrome b [Marinobacter lutaoensis]|jgi:cytochrome b561|uniref:Cytochrome B n=1 Tax=Marinobacter lutaoensis TaxID=135739 RepID=A0A1V2DXA8_9GAMM|nr:cytochrome b [Marinobacter lutaoensis]MBI42901.1 cytochrome b [Oceanospirillales bacterium]NVD34886.1 cytochrome b [Marinobacter lutaoensis]ONF44921.1 cytochrome B [Marinobacter lutaoensis]|tara:strand:+ start:6134 stop:6679 length:546 start_codon:yes stop_codon:yes gene_type:complete